MGLKLSGAKMVSHITTWGLKNIFRRPAANMPGKLALYIDPQLISHLLYKLRVGSMVVCGTNGKTTTNNLVADVLEQQGLSAICNRTGANLDSGVATAMLHGETADWGVFECDELWLVKILPALKSDYLVMLNLFRDQLDRCGEIDVIQDSIASALEASPETVLVYNADDPLCAAIAEKVDNACIAFGVAENMKLSQNTVVDAQMCQQCSGMLAYSYRQYGQLGEYHCPQCGFKRAELDFAAAHVRFESEGLSFEVEARGKGAAVTESGQDAGAAASREAQNTEQVSAQDVDSSLQPVSLGTVNSEFTGAYMVYNLLAARVASALAGCSAESFQKALDRFDPQNGRLQHFDIDGRSILLNLAKNPTGFNQNMRIILQDEGPKAVGFFVNDKEGDGKDISWLWDIDFEELAQDGDLVVFAGGIRKNDLQVRLKYAGLTAHLVEGAADMLDKTQSLPESYRIYAIANYTALPPVHAELTEMEQVNPGASESATHKEQTHG